MHYECLFVVEFLTDVSRHAPGPPADPRAVGPARPEDPDPVAPGVLSLLGENASARRRQALAFGQLEHLVGLGVRRRALMARAVILGIGGILIGELLREMGS